MTVFPYDQFAKQYLAELLTPLGEVETSRDVPGEVRQIDVWFAPAPRSTSAPELLGLLGRLAASPCLLEPFRNQPTPTEVRNCLLKLFELQGELQRKAKRDEERIVEDNLPRLWILSPSASDSLLQGCNAAADEDNWPSGVYFFGKIFRTAIVAINRLPPTPETLWVRILGKGATQKQAINELISLPVAHPLRTNALDLLASLSVNLQARQNLDRDDRELIMNLSPVYLQRLEDAMHQGMQAERRTTIENLLRIRFGVLDEALSAIVEPILALPPEEFTPLLLQLSREELIARFGT